MHVSLNRSPELFFDLVIKFTAVSLIIKRKSLFQWKNLNHEESLNPFLGSKKNRVPTGAEKKDALPCKNGTQTKPCYGFFQFFFGTLPAYFGTQKLTEKKRRKLGSEPKGTEKKNRKKTKNRIFTEKTEAVQIFCSSLFLLCECNNVVG